MEDSVKNKRVCDDDCDGDENSATEPKTKKPRLHHDEAELEPSAAAILTTSNDESIPECNVNEAFSFMPLTDECGSGGGISPLLDIPPPSSSIESERLSAIACPSLPDEILEKILSFLSLKDLCRARGVSKTWNHIAFRSGTWKDVDLCRHWRQEASFGPPPNFLKSLSKIRTLNFTSKFREKPKSSYRIDPVSAVNAFSYPRGPRADVVLADLKHIVDGNLILKTLDTSCASIEPSSIEALSTDDEKNRVEDLVQSVFGNINELETLVVETHNFGFSYVPSIAAQPWAATLKRLSLTLPSEQGVPTRLRVNGNLQSEIATRTNRLIIGSLKDLVHMTSLTSLTLELSFDHLPTSVGPHFVVPLKRVAARLTELRLGFVSLWHALKFWVGRHTAENADAKLNDLLDGLFSPTEEETDGKTPSSQRPSSSSAFTHLSSFHLVNLEGPALDVGNPRAIPLRLSTLSKLLSSTNTVEELCVSGFHFFLPTIPQNAENPFVHLSKSLSSLRFLNIMDKYNNQSLLHVGLVTALSELRHFHRLECDLPPLCWYGLQPIVKKLKSLEIFGLSLSLVTSFLLVIDNVESLRIHAELVPNAVEILQIAAFHLQHLRHLSLFDSSDQTPALRPRNPKVIAQIFAHDSWSRLKSLHLETHDFIPEALRNITANLSALVDFRCVATHANNFFGHSLEADAEKKAVEAFESLGKLGKTLVECRIDVYSRFLFDEADWPSEMLRRVFEDPATVFERLKTLTFIYRCQHGNFCFSITESWRGNLNRAIDFWDDAGEISHYLPIVEIDDDNVASTSSSMWAWKGNSFSAFKEKTRSIVDDEGDWNEDSVFGDDLAEEWDNDAGEEVDELEEEESEDDVDAVEEEVDSVDEVDAVDELDHAP